MDAAIQPLFRAALVVLSATSPGPAATPAQPLAIVAAVRGRVEVIPSEGGPAVRATFGRALERGDRISVSPGGTATVFFNDGNVVELGEKSVMRIGGKATAGPRGRTARELSGDVYANVSRFVTGGSRETGLVALTPLRAAPSSSPLLILPRRTHLLGGRPRFLWRPVEGATRYRVTVTDDQGEVWRRELSDTALAYPTDAEPLRPDHDFAWDVRALSEAGELRREESVVHVLAADDAATVRDALSRIGSAGGADSEATRYLAGSYLFARGLYVEAAEQFEALGRLAPESAAPHEALGQVYSAVGLSDLAAAEYHRALALTRQP